MHFSLTKTTLAFAMVLGCLLKVPTRHFQANIGIHEYCRVHNNFYHSTIYTHRILSSFTDFKKFCGLCFVTSHFISVASFPGPRPAPHRLQYVHTLKFPEHFLPVDEQLLLLKY